MFTFFRLTLLLSLLGLSCGNASAQCSNLGSFDNPACQGQNRTFYASPLPCASGHCRYDFSWGTTQLVSRTANTATYRIPMNAGSYSVMFVSAFDSVNNCTSTMDYTDRYAQFSSLAISGTIPGCPVVGQTYTYTAQCYPNNIFYGVQESLLWTVIGGTNVGTSFYVDPFGLRTDTIKVQWNPSGTRSLMVTRNGNGSTAMGQAYCTHYDTIFAGGTPPPVVSGPAVLCGTTTANYTIPSLDPAFNYTWLCSNGAINSGQGSANVNVTLAGNGTVSLVRTSISCGFSDTTHRAVTLSGSAAPAPNLPASVGVCTGQSAYLNPGTFSSYFWSNLYTSPSISVVTPGTYTVTVTNAAGCQATASTTITNQGPAPTPMLSNTSVCAGTNVILNPGSFSSYLWSTGATTPTISVSVSGTYSVTVTNASGCTGTTSASVTFLSPPSPNLGGNVATCQPNPVTLNPGTFTSYLWSTGATTPTISVATSGTYAVTVTDNNGCSASTSATVTFNALPPFSLGNDTFICADTTILVSGLAGMNSYLWSTGGSTSSILIGVGGTYSLTVSDINGCTASDTIVITGLTDCVFPGDANYDGVVDNTDLLSLGVNGGFTGTTRPGATLNWYGQSATDWGGGLPGNADPKHSDCNGDGIVNAQDTLAITLNYFKTHSKWTGTATGPELRVLSLQDSIIPGDTAWFAVHLGDANFPLDSVHGLAMSLQHSQQGVSGNGWIGLQFDDCWFATPPAQLHLSKNLPQSQIIDIAVTRTDRVDQAGFGEVCRFGILTDSTPGVSRQVLGVFATSGIVVSSTLLPQPVTLVDGQTIISSHTASVEVPVIEPRIYPVPASEMVNVHLQGATSFQIELVDLQGRLLWRGQSTTESMNVDIADLSSGSYFLTILTGSNVWKRKLVVAH